MSLVAQITTQSICYLCQALEAPSEAVVDGRCCPSVLVLVVKSASREDVVDAGDRDGLMARFSGLTAIISTRLRFRDALGSGR